MVNQTELDLAEGVKNLEKAGWPIHYLSRTVMDVDRYVIVTEWPDGGKVGTLVSTTGFRAGLLEKALREGILNRGYSLQIKLKPGGAMIVYWQGSETFETGVHAYEVTALMEVALAITAYAKAEEGRFK